MKTIDTQGISGVCPKCGCYIDYEHNGCEGFDLASDEDLGLDLETDDFDFYRYECHACGAIFWEE